MNRHDMEPIISKKKGEVLTPPELFSQRNNPYCD
jgi:hypothetical protein